MTVTDQIIQAVRSLGLPPVSEDYIRSADKAITQAVHQAAAYARSNEDVIAEYLDKAAAFADEQTGGKYKDKLAKARAAASSGVAAFTSRAEQFGDAAPEAAGSDSRE